MAGGPQPGRWRAPLGRDCPPHLLFPPLLPQRVGSRGPTAHWLQQNNRLVFPGSSVSPSLRVRVSVALRCRGPCHTQGRKHHSFAAGTALGRLIQAAPHFPCCYGLWGPRAALPTRPPTHPGTAPSHAGRGLDAASPLCFGAGRGLYRPHCAPAGRRLAPLPHTACVLPCRRRRRRAPFTRAAAPSLQARTAALPRLPHSH